MSPDIRNGNVATAICCSKYNRHDDDFGGDDGDNDNVDGGDGIMKKMKNQTARERPYSKIPFHELKYLSALTCLDFCVHPLRAPTNAHVIANIIAT